MLIRIPTSPRRWISFSPLPRVALTELKLPPRRRTPIDLQVTREPSYEIRRRRRRGAAASLSLDCWKHLWEPPLITDCSRETRARNGPHLRGKWEHFITKATPGVLQISHIDHISLAAARLRVELCELCVLFFFFFPYLSTGCPQVCLRSISLLVYLLFMWSITVISAPLCCFTSEAPRSLANRPHPSCQLPIDNVFSRLRFSPPRFQRKSTFFLQTQKPAPPPPPSSPHTTTILNWLKPKIMED